MNRSLSTQLSALGLAAFVTVSLMGGIQHLAATPAATDLIAGATTAPAPQVAAAAPQRPAGG